MKFGVIGFGNMGGAIVKGAVASGVLAKEDVLVYDIKESARKAAEEFGLKVAKDDEDVTANSDVTLLAVKPQQMSDAMAQTGKGLQDKAMLSILPGVSVERLRDACAVKEFRILRLLPNTPALVFEGAFACSKENDLTDAERDFATKLLKDTGMHPGQLKDMVTSPAGTTIEGCEVLEDNGFRAATIKCVSAATRKSRSM